MLVCPISFAPAPLPDGSAFIKGRLLQHLAPLPSEYQAGRQCVPCLLSFADRSCTTFLGGALCSPRLVATTERHAPPNPACALPCHVINCLARLVKCNLVCRGALRAAVSGRPKHGRDHRRDHRCLRCRCQDGCAIYMETSLGDETVCICFKAGSNARVATQHASHKTCSD